MKKTWLAYLAIVCSAFTMSIFSACKGNKEQTKDTYNDSEVFKRPDLAGITSRIKEDPDNASLYFERGQMLDQLELDSMAITDFEKAISFDSTRAEYYSAIGAILFDHKDVSGSRKWLERAMTLNPNDIQAHLKMAKLLLFVKDYKMTEEQIGIVLKQDKYNPEAYFILGMMFKDKGDTARAIGSFQAAINATPDYRDAMVQLGQIYAAKNDSLSLKYYDNAFAIDTTDVFPLFAKGVYYQMHDKDEQAKEQYRRAILLDRQYANAYYNMGFLYLKEDSVQKALHQFDLITKISPNDAEAYYQRGLCKEALGSKQEAAADFQQALVFDKEYEEAKIALKRVEK